MFWLLLLFVVVPAVELYILIQIGASIGAGNTLLLILATGVAGSWLAKTQGMATWRALNERWYAGQIPGKELMDGAIILVCGTLLLTPGVLTDAIGLLGLFPLTRSAFRGVLKRVFTSIPTVRVRFGAATSYNDIRGNQTQNASSATSENSNTKDFISQGSSKVTGQESPVLSGSAKSRPSHENPS